VDGTAYGGRFEVLNAVPGILVRVEPVNEKAERCAAVEENTGKAFIDNDG
jgi:hypothetical protein